MIECIQSSGLHLIKTETGASNYTQSVGGLGKFSSNCIGEWARPAICLQLETGDPRCTGVVIKGQRYSDTTGRGEIHAADAIFGLTVSTKVGLDEVAVGGGFRRSIPFRRHEIM